jgi:nucleoside-diphosphate-sugar epimerase
MKAFVTGHRGYIGTHLVDVLKQHGHQVTGADIGLFDGCEWEQPAAADRELVKDVRDLTVEDLEGHDVVMHLAALSNDPMGALDSSLTLDINRDASVRLAEIAKQAGVQRYLFAGSCSVYGKGDRLDLNENDPLNPLTAYAQSKIETEAALWQLADDDFSPASLRNSTAYGHSPNLRIDLVVNNLLASALSYGEIRIQSDGSPWRPLIHCAARQHSLQSRQRRRQPGELPGPGRRRSCPAADPAGHGRLHRRSRSGSPELSGQLRSSGHDAPGLPAEVHPGDRHGGTASEDARLRVQQVAF